MTELSVKLNDIADVLEKTAIYLEKLETKEVEEQKNFISKEYVNPVVEKLAEMSGIDMDKTLTDKLASVDPDILDVMKRLAFRTHTESSESLGGPAESSNIKTGAASDNEDDDALLNFCLK